MLNCTEAEKENNSKHGPSWLPYTFISFNEIYFPVGDITNELVRHFLIETSAKGVRLKGCPNEPYFGEFTRLSRLFM